MLDCMKHRMMLGFFANDVARAIHLTTRESEHSEIARFSSAAGENDFVWLGFDKRGDFVARVIDRSPRIAPCAMNT